jgi:hypothetical protein
MTVPRTPAERRRLALEQQRARAKPEPFFVKPLPKLPVPDLKKVFSKFTEATPPSFAHTKTEQTPEGTVHTVTWTDSVKFRFNDRFALLPASLVLSALSIASAHYMQTFVYAFGNRPNPWASFSGVIVLSTMLFWTWWFWHERWRQTTRSVSVLPDGTIRMTNPPPHSPLNGTNGKPVSITKGLQRVGSIEYTHTTDWLYLNKEKVHSAEHWWEVHMFVGDEWRLSVSRSMGSRDHAHQVSAHLNRLKAELMRPKPITAARPVQAID